MPNDKFYDYDTSIKDDDNIFNGSKENCEEENDNSEYYNDIKIVETDTDNSKFKIDNNPKYIKPPKDIIINASIIIGKEQQNDKKNLDIDEDDNFFQIDNRETDEYREFHDYGYDQYDEYLRGCKEVKRCNKACNKVHKMLCVEFNCRKLKIIFKEKCREKCEDSFSEEYSNSETSSGDYNGRNDYY